MTGGEAHLYDQGEGQGENLYVLFLMHPAGSRDLNWVWQETSTDSP